MKEIEVWGKSTLWHRVVSNTQNTMVTRCGKEVAATHFADHLPQFPCCGPRPILCPICLRPKGV